MHWYVYANLRRVLRRDYPKLGKRLAKIALGMFIVLDMPFFFIYFRGMSHAALTVLTRMLLYPFLIWQTIMLMWVIILFPITAWRWLRKLWAFLLISVQGNRKQDNSKNGKEIVLEVAAE